MESGLSKQQEAVLTRALIEGGTCPSTKAYAVLVNLGGTPEAGSNESSILASVGSTLQSLVELGLMAKRGSGEYYLTEEGFRVAENRGEKSPFA